MLRMLINQFPSYYPYASLVNPVLGVSVGLLNMNFCSNKLYNSTRWTSKILTPLILTLKTFLKQQWLVR
jgi:hypothetical protein